MRAIQIFVIATGSIIVLGLLALFAMGRRPGAGRVSGSVELDAPPAAAMAWLTEPAKLRRWVGFLAAVTGDTGAAAVGRRQAWTMDDGHSPALTMNTELLAYAPPDSLRRRLEVPGLVEGENRFVLEGVGGRTRLTVSGTYRHPNPIVALLEPLVTPEAQAKLQADLARLRTQVALAAAADSTGPGAEAPDGSAGDSLRSAR